MSADHRCVTGWRLAPVVASYTVGLRLLWHLGWWNSCRWHIRRVHTCPNKHHLAVWTTSLMGLHRLWWYSALSDMQSGQWMPIICLRWHYVESGMHTCDPNPFWLILSWPCCMSTQARRRIHIGVSSAVMCGCIHRLQLVEGDNFSEQRLQVAQVGMRLSRHTPFFLYPVCVSDDAWAFRFLRVDGERPLHQAGSVRCYRRMHAMCSWSLGRQRIQGRGVRWHRLVGPKVM